MTKYFISALLCLLPGALIAQKSLRFQAVPINSDQMGRSSKMSVGLISKKHVFHFGLGYMYNPYYHAPYYGAVYVHKSFARNFIEHLTLNVGYERSIYFKGGDLRVYPFVELSFAKMGTKSEGYMIREMLDNGYRAVTYNFVWGNRSVTWLMMRIGFGCEIPVTKTLGITQQAGIAPAYVYETAPRGNETTFEYSFQVPHYALGFTYKL
jgi:hypothetical protein